MRAIKIKENILKGEYNKLLLDIYGDSSLLKYQTKRYEDAINRYIELYGDDDISIYSVPGRSEISGNHTDHQHGCVLVASINLDIIGIVSKNEKSIKIVSDGFEIKEIFLDDLTKKEKGTSEAIICGIAYKLKEEGYKIGGFNAYIASDVLVGAGLSSSAAFEVLIGTIINGLYNDMKIDTVKIAKIGQFAENEYFGKPCGLMDQCACSVGGLISIDFKNPLVPIINHLDVDFSKYNYSICIVDTKGSHADLTNEYASIPREMKKIANFFKNDFLRDVDEETFYKNISNLRTKYGDRSVLRAIHFFNENKRINKIIDALNNDDFDSFKKQIKESGNSSYKFLQNIYASNNPQNQAISIGLAVSEIILENHGVCRVHGGGFAGTIQVFVDNGYVKEYKEKIEKIFGKGSCHILKIRKYGGCKVLN